MRPVWCAQAIGVTGALGSDAMDQIRTVTPGTIECGQGDKIEKAVRALLAKAVAQAAALERRMESATGSAKGGGASSLLATNIEPAATLPNGAHSR